MVHPGISIIIPTRRQPHTLERTLCSVLDQDQENLELIVIDGGGDEPTAAVLRCYEDDLAVWERMVGRTTLGDALNRGLSHATGQIVGILPGDDVYLPAALDSAAAMMSGPEGAPWLVGHCLRIDQADRTVGRMEAAVPESLVRFLMHESGLLPAAASFYRRDLLLRSGGFDPHLEAAVAYELAARLMIQGHLPRLTTRVLAAAREAGPGHVRRTLRHGLAYVQAAEHHARDLGPLDREALRRTCDERRHIYALAEAERRQGAIPPLHSMTGTQAA